MRPAGRRIATALAGYLPSEDGGDRPVLLAGGLEQPTPGRHVGATTQQSATLPLGHAAPYPPLDRVVERFSQTLGAYRTQRADLLGAVLCGPPDEKLVRAQPLARREIGPMLIRTPYQFPLPISRSRRAPLGNAP